MIYKIIFASVAKRQFDKLPKQIQKQLGNAIAKLAYDPRPHGTVKLIGKENLYRIRDGNYRAIYQIKNDQLLILVVKIGHRKDVYKKK